MKKLIEKIQRKEACVYIIGLGYVGLPLLLALVKRGFHAGGIDTDPIKIDSLQRGESYIDDIPSSQITAGKLPVYTDFKVLSQVDVVILCVPTPLDTTGAPDLSYLLSAVHNMLPHLKKHTCICIESTVYPGVTREVVAPLLESAGYSIGSDLFLCFSPERIDPGNKEWTVENTPKVFSGITKSCLRIGQVLYEQITDSAVPVSSTDAAEMVKLVENAFRAVNIAFVNEMMALTDKLGIDIREVLDAAGTKPFGFMQFFPGPGVGGHCIPVDPSYLTWKLRKLGTTSRFIDLAIEVNKSMPAYWINKIKEQIALPGSSILVLGVTYKRDIADMRESPALDILSLLIKEGAKVAYHDPYVPSLQISNNNLTCVQDLMAEVDKSDCILLVTDHSCYAELPLPPTAINCRFRSSFKEQFSLQPTC
ncbi:MAG: UDP-N-acetyl-D-glucosamine 6-dehydrogenase [Chlamydiales bacterium]|nr:UDP-N-acetyl-D-glucosamine 6-dehydrogenase [Chlamydiales bacterium]MCH9620239.1 UDP-N-acetyl-D-glucosamine 6-dehydrogenase [Chlamydiales bacterium]MCH9622851.1 UDP-N-acetyl-D-glucosamine 6-dehydrogenase [Chlamydiales bacterium]